MLALLLGCATLSPAPPCPGDCAVPTPRSATSTAPPASNPGGPGPVHALLVNGGAGPEHNYASHLLHLQEMRAALLARGLAPADIDVFCSDGGDEGADMATMDVPESTNFLVGTPAEALVEATLVDTRWDGVPLRPATRTALDDWFRHEGTKLAAGDTLLLYTTDHGTEAGLNLWHDTLSPSDLRRMSSALPSGVRMVSVMSQCHSGTFVDALPSGVPDGRWCGFYSVPRDLVAYGCYAGGLESRLGHGFRFVDALGTAATLADAERVVRLQDDSPDVPISSSDLYLERLLRAEAARRKVGLSALVDTLLPEGGSDPLLAELGARFGLPTLRTLLDVETERARADAAEGTLGEAETAWTRLLAEANTDTLAHLGVADRQWPDRIGAALVGDLDAPARLELRDQLAAALQAQAATDGTLPDLLALGDRIEAVRDARWRALTRRRVADRAARLLLQEAGERLLAAPGHEDEARGYEALRTCEKSAIGTAPGTPTAAAEPWAPAADDEVTTLAPRWLGVRLADDDGRRIDAILPGSPASGADLAPGDRFVTIDGRPVGSRSDVVTRIALAAPGRPLAVELERGGVRRSVQVQPAPRP